MGLDGLALAVEPEDLGAPLGWSDQAEQQADRRGLTRPIGAEVTHHLALGQLEVEISQRIDAAVALGQAHRSNGSCSHRLDLPVDSLTDTIPCAGPLPIIMREAGAWWAPVARSRRARTAVGNRRGCANPSRHRFRCAVDSRKDGGVQALPRAGRRDAARRPEQPARGTLARYSRWPSRMFTDSRALFARPSRHAGGRCLPRGRGSLASPSHAWRRTLPCTINCCHSAVSSCRSAGSR